MPLFDLSALENRETPLAAKLKGDDHIRERYVERFCHTFKSYFEWKKIAEFGGKFLSRH
jgi:hypothetical protein